MNGAVRPISVGELNEYLKDKFAGDPALRMLCVEGEISNFTSHTSGHLYFTLKDRIAVIKAVMFKGYRQVLTWKPVDGAKVMAIGDVCVYPKGGVYQLYVQHLYPSGVGEVYADFEYLKKKLEEEGLFANGHKKTIPRFPRKVGIISSPTGAAVRDIKSVLMRRNDSLEIRLFPVLVQGKAAAREVCEALRAANTDGTCDVLIIARGGGSLEDLYAFNDEMLAREIYASKIPVISAVGHETDFTIADFVADLRAPTPSVAAELATADKQETLIRLQGYQATLSALLERKLREEEIEVAQAEIQLRDCFSQFLKDMREDWQEKNQSISNVFSGMLFQKKMDLEKMCARLEAADPMSAMRKGLAQIRQFGKIVSSSKDLQPGTLVQIHFGDGVWKAELIELEGNKYDV